MYSTAMQQAEPESREEPITFTATGSEYFRIWIVNLLLTVVTVGIYSAWAKVRRNQYFYANTRLAGGGFEYHASPGAILKGRVVAGLLIGGYNLAFKVSPVAGLCMLVLLMAVMPWLIWKSLQFALHNSSYRGIRFGFDGSAKDAYFHYLVLPLLGVVSLGLAYPFVHQRIKRFQHTQSRYGSTRFAFDAPVAGFYKVYGVVFGLMVLGVLAMIAVVVGGGRAGVIDRGMVVFAPFAMYPYMLVVMFVALAALQNLIWNHTSLGRHRFRSTMKVGGLAALYVTNTLGIVVTLGLFTPFAVVRSLKYRLEHTALIVEGSLDDVTAGQRSDIGAIGDGAADLAGFDLAL
jgi:uncharacterized membrane protein YjgN (DUF898 family)